MRRPLRPFFASLVVLSSLVAIPIACSSSNDPGGTPADAGEIETAIDFGHFEEPAFDSDDPRGRVLLLPLYHPDTRCFEPPTGIGHFDEGPDGKIKPCEKKAVCYVRPDGVVAYHTEDCIHGKGAFLANWTTNAYSDLGPCEPVKNMKDSGEIKDCPNVSCLWARDVMIDTAKGCATSIASKGCRSKLGLPTGCWCEDGGTGRVFVHADPKISAAPPGSFTRCDAATSEPCNKALAIVDTVKGCTDTTAPVDAGPSDTGAAVDAPAGG